VITEKYQTLARQGIALTEPTIFERSSSERQSFALAPLDVPEYLPSQYRRAQPAELPEVSELQVVRHFTRLSSWNYAIDLGTFPLGSCTMKYNPRINEEIAALAGLAEIHPDLPIPLSQGALEVIFRLENALCSIAGMDACSTQPAAGAHGELTGLLLIRAFHENLGGRRRIVLIPDTAHGTNPASCILAGFEAVTLKSSSDGYLHAETVKQAINLHQRDIAALMMTNPNTLGIFESDIAEIAELIHGIGAQLYMDGANMNAIMGVTQPGKMGVDVMQYNLHKTFSTPHGGGGPGSGPVAVKSHLAPYLPGPRVVKTDTGFGLDYPAQSIGQIKSYFGNFGVLVRALCYIYRHGETGLKEVSRTAVLNANYLKSRLSEYFEVASKTPSLHEAVLTDQRQIKSHGVKTLQIAKSLIDEGFHPPTIYFPLVVPGAMLIEPTETESLEELKELVNALGHIADLIAKGDTQFEQKPHKPVVGKVDEVGATRHPILSLDDRP